MILLECELVGESSSSYVRADFSISVFSVLGYELHGARGPTRREEVMEKGRALTKLITSSNNHAWPTVIPAPKPM
jgi:hypothetical protein